MAPLLDLVSRNILKGQVTSDTGHYDSSDWVSVTMVAQCCDMESRDGMTRVTCKTSDSSDPCKLTGEDTVPTAETQMRRMAQNQGELLLPF